MLIQFRLIKVSILDKSESVCTILLLVSSKYQHGHSFADKTCIGLEL